MRDRLQLHERLINVSGYSNVYYQPPENFKMVYPCIRYNQTVGDTKRASNKVYSYTKKYTITCIINNDKDDIIMKMLNSFEYCELDNTFVSDNLYHYVFTLYY